MNSTITVRRAGPGDAQALARQRALLHREVTSDEWSADEIAAFSKRCEAFIREKLETGEHIAWIAVKIQTMKVNPACRFHGVGRRLVEAIVSHLRERGIERIILGPAPDARGFYESFQYTPLMQP